MIPITSVIASPNHAKRLLPTAGVHDTTQTLTLIEFVVVSFPQIEDLMQEWTCMLRMTAVQIANF